MKRRDVVLFGFAAAGSAAAQKAAWPSYFDAGLKERWKLSKHYSLAMLAKMPDQYLSFRPVPEVWTFSQQVTHLADANILMSAPLRGEKPDYVGDPKQLGRAELEKHLKDSYEVAAMGFDRLKSDADAEEMVQFLDDRIAKRDLCYRLAGSRNASPVAGAGLFAAEGDSAAGICVLKRGKGVVSVSALCHHAYPSGLT